MKTLLLLSTKVLRQMRSSRPGRMMRAFSLHSTRAVRQSSALQTFIRVLMLAGVTWATVSSARWIESALRPIPLVPGIDRPNLAVGIILINAVPWLSVASLAAMALAAGNFAVDVLVQNRRAAVGFVAVMRLGYVLGASALIFMAGSHYFVDRASRFDIASENHTMQIERAAFQMSRYQEALLLSEVSGDPTFEDDPQVARLARLSRDLEVQDREWLKRILRAHLINIERTRSLGGRVKTTRLI